MDEINYTDREHLESQLYEIFDELYRAEGNGEYEEEEIRTLSEHAANIVHANDYEFERGEGYEWMRRALDSDGSGVTAIKLATLDSVLE